VQGYRPYEPDEFSEAESQDSQESLSGYVQSRWDDTKAERRYAYGTDACVKFSGVRRMEWNRPEWKDGLLKAAVFKVMAMNRVYKGISAPPAEWQFEVERQKAGRLAEEARLIKAEKERVRKEKMKSKLARKEARANARGERQAVIEKQLMQQNTQAQTLVEDMEEALLKVPELQPPGVPGLHPQELFEARLVLHDLATSGLGQKVSQLGGAPAIPNYARREPPPPRKVQNWNQETLSSWFHEVLRHYPILLLALPLTPLAEADVQKTLNVQVSSALSADDSCDRGASNACGLGALQAAVHARSAKERSQESKLNEEDRSIFAASLIEKADAANEKSNSSLSMSSDSMTTDLKTNGNEALRALEHLMFNDLNLNDTQIDKLFKGVVLAVATEAERKNQNAMGRGVLKLLRQAALKALRAQKSDPFDVQPGYSWLEENEVEYARASLALPITGGSILILALVSLNFFHRTFGPAKDDQVGLPGNLSPGLDTTSTATPPLSENLETGFEDRVDENATTPGSTSAIDDYAMSVSSGDESMEPKKEEEVRASFNALFRFARTWDLICTTLAMVLGAVHGACMPMAFFFLSDLYQAVYMPNDDGSLPPVHAPHTIRDSKVAEVGMTYVLLALVVLVARTGGCYLIIKAADRQVVAARRQYFYQILMQGPSWHDMHNASELAPQLVQDTHLFRDGIGERLVDFTRACFMAVSATVLACSRDWKVSILMAIIMPIAGMCMALSVEVVRNFSTVVEACYAKAGQVAVTATELIKTVTAFNGQRLELEAFNGHVDEAHINAIQIGVVAGYATGLVNTVLITGMSLGVYFGSQWVLQDYEADCWRASPPFGNCRTGGTIMSAMYTIIWGFTMGLGTMNMCFVAFANARAAMHRIGTILDEPLSATSGGKILPHVEGEIIFSDVFFAYPKRTESLVLKGVTLEIKANCTTAFVGGSGSGKSTLVGLLLRFYEPKTGTVCLDGTDVRTLELQWFRSKLALVEQEPVLFQDTIYENIAAGSANSVTKADVEQAIPQASAHDFISTFPRGYQTMVGEAGAQLSGGQKQRLAIARALIRKPAVLLLDEATSALDSASERAVQKALDDLLDQGGRTTIVIAHRLSTVRNAHQICVLDKGKVVEQGTHEELMSKKGAYDKLLSLQMSASKDADVPPAEKEETTAVLPAQAPAPAPAAHGAAQELLEAPSSKEPDADDQAQGKTDEDRCLKLAKSYDFEKDLGTAFAVKEVWRMSRQDYKYYMIGVGFTLLGSRLSGNW
ncbi:Abcb1, partial [Symbiodinium necroappetens]